MSKNPTNLSSNAQSLSSNYDGSEHLQRKMKPRHLVMMSLGCAIGTGLFVGTGKAIAVAGPGVLIAFAIASLLVILIMRMIGEMVAANPCSGALSVYVADALGATAGSTVGWLWWLALVVSVAAEATASSVILHNFIPSIPQWVMALSFLVAFTLFNLAAASKFGEMEFWFAGIKIAAILAFLAVGISLALGLVPNVPSPGLTNLFGNGDFLPNGLAGVGAALLIVTFTYGGTEIIAIAAAESSNPKENIAKAVRSMVYRIIVLFILPVTVMVTVLPWSSPELITSPFVAVFKAAGLPSVQVAMALVIALALLSSLNANIYAASRLVFSLSERDAAPKFLSKVASNKVPRAAVLASVSIGFVAIVLNYLWPETVLLLLLNAVGSVNLLLWVGAVISQIILRKRADSAGIELSFKMWCFPYLSYLAGFILVGFIVLSLLDNASRYQIFMTGAVAVIIAFLCKRRIAKAVPLVETVKN
ncbi:GABA permease [Pseudomonas fluorescens]|uniref:amino acid permease n=1 Tax=Pseudomonas fluorescens TaxID=294 RepID=UPI0012571787|nr:amino acid permease [Pseudomonas fluorescens]VVO54071.1 GABA permease [Pseudomonas fluorescens]